MEFGTDAKRWKGKLLEVASAIGNIDLTRALLQAGVEISTASVAGRTPIYNASRNGHLDVLKQLVEARGDITIPDVDGRTPLYVTAFHGHIEEAKFLLEHGADISITNKHRRTPLSLAAEFGHLKLVKFFLEKGADIEGTDEGGWTPLCWAACKGHADVVEMLLDNGADITIKANDGWTPLCSASSNGHVGVVKLLISRGVDVTVTDNNGWTALYAASLDGRVEVVKTLLEHDSSTEDKMNEGCTPLYAASGEGHIEVVRELLAKRADVSAATNTGGTSLGSACAGGHMEIVKVLIEHGANISGKDIYGWTPLGVAAGKGHTEVVRILIAHRADLSTSNNLGEMPLHIASVNGHVKAISVLLENGADASAPDNTGEAPLAAALAHGHTEVAFVLLDHGADAVTSGKGGWSPLHIASSSGYGEVVKALLRKGAAIDAVTDDWRWTALNVASNNGHANVVSILLDHSASTTIPDKTGRLPVTCASMGGHTDVVNFLLERSTDVILPDSERRKLFVSVCLNGYVGVVKAFLKHWTDIPFTDYDGTAFTPVIAACFNGHVDVLRFLLANGFSLSQATKDGLTPLHTAAERGQLEVLRVLLEDGVAMTPNKLGFMPLHIAAGNGQPGIAKILIENGADISDSNNTALQTPLCVAAQAGHVEVLKLLLEKGSSMGPDQNGSTPLHFASVLGSVEAINLLLEHGATISTNELGATPLYLAAFHGKIDAVKIFLEKVADVSAAVKTARLAPLQAASLNGHVEVVKVLLEFGADVRVLGDHGSAPVYLASIGGHEQVMQLLLENGASANHKNDDGSTPLIVASQQGHLNVVQLLLRHSVDVNLAKEHGGTPLFVASDEGHVEVVRALLHAGANVNAHVQSGFTPLFQASTHGHVEVTELLLRNGADVSLAVEDGRLAIHMASIGGHIEVVKLLLEYGSNLEVAENFGMTPLVVAASEGHIDLVKMLIEKYADPKIAQIDGRLLVDQPRFATYMLIAQRNNQTQDMEDDGVSESWADTVDAWGQIQSRLLDQGERLFNDRTQLALPRPPLFDDKARENDLSLVRGAHSESVVITQLRPPSGQSNPLCDACRGILENGVGSVSVDIFSGVREFVAGAFGKRTKAESLPSNSHQSYTFLHHLSAHSLYAASLQGCHICRVVWGHVDARLQQLLLVSDVESMDSETPRVPFTFCVLMDMAELIPADVGLDDTGTIKYMWAVGFHGEVLKMMNRGPSYMSYFTFIPSQEAKRVNLPDNLPATTDSPETISFAARHFQNCIQNHEECRGSRDEQWLPSRLICLDDADENHTARLVASKDIASGEYYCSLSHCWGSAQFLKLTTDNVDNFGRGIPTADLPKTFLDSFIVSRKLGIRYVWIDSLCIIQDDPEDWMNEASQMHKVYANSMCNICATGFEDSSPGLFTTRDPDAFKPCDVEIPWLDGGGSFRILDLTMWNVQVMEAPLNMRAWVIQEHFLAPRHLHFGTSQVFWECLHTTAAEQFPDVLPAEIIVRRQSSRRHLQGSESIPQDTKRASSLRLDWVEIVKSYTKAKLSRPQDKLIAFSGISKRFESILDDTCVAGIWRGFPERDLLWYLDYCRQGDGTPSVRPETYRAPSFSWMSVDGAVSELDSGMETKDLLAQVLSLDIEPRGVRATGSIRLKGMLRPLKLHRSQTPSGVMWLPRFQHGKAHLGWALSMSTSVFMDVDQEYDGDYFCMLISAKFAEAFYGGLVLRETGNAKGEFTRIGFLQCMREDKELLRGYQDREDAYPCESYDAIKKTHVISIV